MESILILIITNIDTTLKKNYKHSIEVLVDRLVVKNNIQNRLSDSIEIALTLSDGLNKNGFSQSIPLLNSLNKLIPSKIQNDLPCVAKINSSFLI